MSVRIGTGLSLQADPRLAAIEAARGRGPRWTAAAPTSSARSAPART
jgi:hypothetical protein